jgi:tetratricopeptide (TPR) repeat protein
MSNAERIRALRQAGDHEGARSLAVELVAVAAGDCELQYEAACVHDYLGREAAAIPFYLAAIADGLPPEQLRGAYLGLGSTYRALGQYPSAEQALSEGLTRFPDAAELKTFLAMALHNLGKSKQAVELLLTVIADTCADQHLCQYRKALMSYAHDIERSWK